MQTGQEVSFGPYRLSGPHGPLFYRSQSVTLPPKAVAVLWHLVSHAGQVVSKDELLTTVWGDTVVSESVLTVCLGTLRKALREKARTPRYIETVHRIGYRFIEKVVSSQQSAVSREENQQRAESKEQRAKLSNSSPAPNPQHPAPVLVGRDAELTQLHSLFAKAINGERQLVFVTGEAGIGKTALVDAFLFGVRSRKEFGVRSQEEFGVQRAKLRTTPNSELSSTPVFVTAGQCIEHYGTGEAYLPVLEALGRLCRQADGERVLSVLRRVAPSWLLQLPTLLTEAERAVLQQQVAGVTRERMLREMVEALEVLSVERPLVLVLEDVHWSDVSTIDLLNLLVRRREAARLLVLATNRQADLVVNEHPLRTLKQELVTRGQATEMLLGGLQAAAVRHYVGQRFAEPGGEGELGSLVYERTEGHPLFMVQLTDYLTRRGELEARTAAQELVREIPQQLRGLIEVQVARLTPEEQRVLEAGSVAGAEFTIASMAAVLEKTNDEIETLCEQLSHRGQFIVEREVSRWPDGTVSGRYGFRHALYQEVLYQRLSASRCARLHHQIGLREEAAYGARAAERAAELAVHFERGLDYQRAVQYLQLAGENALNRSAQVEAIVLLSHARAVLRSQPETNERAQQELALLLVLGPALVAGKGHGASEVEHVYRHAAALCEQLPQLPHRSAILSGLGGYYMAHGDFAATFALGEQLLPVAQQNNQPIFEIQARRLLGTTFYWQGQFIAGRENLEKGIVLANAHAAPFRTAFTLDPGVACRSYAAFTLWALGYPTQAVAFIQDAVTVARRLLDPHSLAFALEFVSRVYLLCREGVRGQQSAETLQAHATEYGFSYFQRQGLFDQGWALVEQGQAKQGITLIRQALAALQEIGIRLGHSQIFAVLGEAYGQVGQSEEGLRLISEALADIEQSGERVFEAELWRIAGELSLRHSPMHPFAPASLEECFQKAVAIARQQQAKSLELRAVMSLVRLRQQQTQHESCTTQHVAQQKLEEAHQMLSGIYNWFTEGFDTKDLQEAKALIEELGEMDKWGKG